MNTTTTTTATAMPATIETNNGISHMILANGMSFPINLEAFQSGICAALASIYDSRFMSHNEIGVVGGWVRNGWAG